MFEFLPQTKGDLVALRVNGSLDRDDYERILIEIEKRLQAFGSLRIYWQMNDFHGWTAGGMWEECVFDARHAWDFTRVAMVGEAKWQEWMTQLMKPFTSAEVRYFDVTERKKALTWISETDALDGFRDGGGAFLCEDVWNRSAEAYDSIGRVDIDLI